MMRKEIYSIFLSAKAKVLQDLKDHNAVQQRLGEIEAVVESSATMIRNLHLHRPVNSLSIPAYYDPNMSRIHINSRILKTNTRSTVFIICYHELIHGASIHMNYQEETTNIFRSGIKIEHYTSKKYHCQNRLLNEGIVQYFTNNHNHIPDESYAYKNEVALVRRLVNILGEHVIADALFHEEYFQLVHEFNEIFSGQFNYFSNLIDEKQYHQAQTIITIPQTVTVPLFSPLSVVHS